MTNPWIAAPATFSCWWILGAVFCGLGFLVRRLFGLRTTTEEALFSSFWTGWSVTILGLQLWHFWFRIHAGVLLVLCMAGAAGLIWNLADLGRLLRWKPLPAGLLIAVGLWASSLAIGPVSAGDTGLYHWPTVKWMLAYPVVPGIGNLLGHLAYNSSFLLYAALLESGPWPVRSFSLANGTLLFAALAQAVLCSCRSLSSRSRSSTHDLFFALLLGPLLAVAVDPTQTFPSLATDTVVFVLGAVLASQLFRIFAETGTDDRTRDGRFLTMTLLTAVGVTVKLSLAAFAGPAFLVSFGIWLSRSGHGLKRRCRLAALAALCGSSALVPWILRFVVMTGYLVYPGAFGALDVEWRVPRPLALDMARYIAGWARRRGVHWATVTDSWDWLPMWLEGLPAAFVRTAVLAAVLILAAILARVAGRRRAGVRRPWPGLFFLPSVATLVFTAWKAPDPRFTGASLAVLAAGLAVFGLPRGTWRIGPRRRLRSTPALWAAFLVSTAVPALVAQPPVPEPFRGAPYDSVPRGEYEVRTTDSGLRVHTPRGDVFCWDIPLPCTLYFRPNLRSIVDGDLGSGFVLDDTFTFAFIKETVPPGFDLSPEIGAVTVSGWNDPESRPGPRVFVDGAKMLLYTERETAARLVLRPRRLRVNLDEVGRGSLRVLVNGELAHDSLLEPPAPIEADLELRRDFNTVVFEISAPEHRPPNSPGQHLLHLVLDGIEVRKQ